MKLIVDYFQGDAVPDNMVEHYIEQHTQFLGVSIGTECMLLGYRLAHKEKRVNIEEVVFSYLDKPDFKTTINENGKLERWPSDLEPISEYLKKLI